MEMIKMGYLIAALICILYILKSVGLITSWWLVIGPLFIFVITALFIFAVIIVTCALESKFKK